MSVTPYTKLSSSVDSLDGHVEELHRAVTGAALLIRAYDEAALRLITIWDTAGTGFGDLVTAVRDLKRVYERRQV